MRLREGCRKCRLPTVLNYWELPPKQLFNAVRFGVLYEIDGFIKALKLLYPRISVFLTGGYAFYFEKRIKNRIFAVSNLVPIGLNKILIYNDSL